GRARRSIALANGGRACGLPSQEDREKDHPNRSGKGVSYSSGMNASMFKKIGRKLALQFTGFVFLLLLITGAIFLAADLENARRQTEQRLMHTVQIITQQEVMIPGNFPGSLPPQLREHVRVLDSSGNVLYAG